MRYRRSAIPNLVARTLLVLLTTGLYASGQQYKPSSHPSDIHPKPGTHSVPAGQKTKINGSIVRRDADTFIVRDNRDIDTVVLLTGRTSVKSKGGFLRWGKNYEVTSLLRGLPVEVEGIGNREGQLVADKVRFNSADLKVAQLVERRVAPVEQANERLSGQVDELGEVSRMAREDAGKAHERISALDDYIVQDSATVLFRVNSTVISPDDRRALDELAQRAVQTKGYLIEVAGYTDSSGNVNHNRVLSQRRADAVVRYLQENHDIPLRRIVTPFGYGEMRPVADNSSEMGRRQNRRVEVKVLINRGITASRSGP